MRILKRFSVSKWTVRWKQRHDTARSERIAQRGALAGELSKLENQNVALALDFISRNPPHFRLLAVRKDQRVWLFQVAPEIARDLANFAPTRDELVHWAGGGNVWEIVDQDAAHLAGSESTGWPLGFGKSLRLLISRADADPAAVLWQHLINNDGSDDPTTPFRSIDPDVRRRRSIIALGARNPQLAPLLYRIEALDEPKKHAPPYGEDPLMREGVGIKVAASPRKRSVLFVNPAYYNFYYLAEALRNRGWDAVSMSIMEHDSTYSKQFHGHDWNLYAPRANAQLARFRNAFQEAAGRFDMLHFHGVGTMSFFPYNYDTNIDHDRVPWDVLEMKRRGAKIAYSITGCHDLVTPSTFEAWSPGMCPKCPWRVRPEICSNQRMAAWGWKVQQLADLICLETDPPLGFRDTPAVFREPLSFAVDPEHWRPDLARTIPVPDEWREPRAPGEVLIYHSVGNYEERSRNGVNVKGTGAVIRAINRLKAEGRPVRLLFRKEVPSIHNRWMLAQADIIVDQLNYGRYGATAREGLMLGRPVVGRLNKVEPRGLSPVRCIAESPIVDASEETVYEVLKRLVENPEERARIGDVSRVHALKWWSKDVLAERYERVYDHLHTHGRPPLTLD